MLTPNGELQICMDTGACCLLRPYFEDMVFRLDKTSDTPQHGEAIYGFEPEEAVLLLTLSTPISAKKTAPVLIVYPNLSHHLFHAIRNTYQTESVAGGGDTIDKAMRIAKWLNHLIKANSEIITLPSKRNAATILHDCLRGKLTLNCRGYAIVCQDLLSSISVRSRVVVCRPSAPYDPECHYVNEVFSPEYGKWVVIDAAFRCFITDENKNPLNMIEIRENIRLHMPMRLWSNQKARRVLDEKNYWYGLIKKRAKSARLKRKNSDRKKGRCFFEKATKMGYNTKHYEILCK